jgi:hypothetical protein
MAQKLTDFIIADTVIRFHVRDSAKFGTCVSVNGILQLNLKCAHSPLNLRIYFNKCPIYIWNRIDIR